MTSATHGSRPACQSRITAASIISRSASGSATLPNCDSTRQRRARKPSTWSVIAATPKTIAAGQLWPWSEERTSPTKTGMSASRTSVSAFGSCASGAGTARVAIRAQGYGSACGRWTPRRIERLPSPRREQETLRCDGHKAARPLLRDDLDAARPEVQPLGGGGGGGGGGGEKRL